MTDLLEILRLEYWPLLVAMGVLLAAAIAHAILGRVPSVLMLLAVAAAWAAAFARPPLFGGQALAGGILGSLLCTVTPLVVFLKYWKLGLPADCMKPQMAFGAWVGCALAWDPAVVVTFATSMLGFCFTLILTIAYGRICGRPVDDNFDFADTYSSSSTQGDLEGEFFDYEPPRPFKIPAQLLLSVGTITGLLFFFWLDAQNEKKPYFPHNQRRVAAQAQLRGANG
ncbi:MAG: hypothetical protein L0211_00710 [Planctomycetaceae bacterium]|nr:hypothetical protein [Planctomycetaceae bacterium]